MNLSIGSKVYHVDYNKNEIVDFEIIGIITRKSSVEYIINDLYKWYENHSYDCYDDDDEINLYVKTKFNDKDLTNTWLITDVRRLSEDKNIHDRGGKTYND